jgi:hypothetical protein
MASQDNYVNREIIMQVDATASAPRRALFPAIRWGAVLAGVAVDISVQLALMLLGIATGLASLDVTQGDTFGTGPLLWAGFSMLVAAFVGGYVAARMSGLKRKSDGVLHGAVSWAVTTILFAMLATSVGGTLVSGVFGNMNQLARARASSAGSIPGVTGTETLVSLLLRTQGVHIDAGALQQLQQLLRAGQRDRAAQLLANATGLDTARSTMLVDEALALSGLPLNASPQARGATENAVQKAGTAAWLIFLAVALALAIGIGGGALGAAGARRVSWAGNTGSPG